MDKDIAIKVENLSKVYKLYNAPIDRLKESLHFRGKKYHKDFYALNDVSFEIKKGECVGILGTNGAGKSTLLKIITGVLTPSGGKVTVNGNVSAILELGAGFNPEYTGIENIYFQCGLMGYEDGEIESKLSNILEFADIGEFINQPFKTYSSGMAARLAFAVAINIEPDILIVDEALSVGDAGFQNKCIRKMIQIMEAGVTVLFVSHDIQAVNKFCSKAIWLKNGCKHMDGSSEEVTNSYMAFSAYGLENLADNYSIAGINNTESTSLTHNEWLLPVTGESFGEGKAKILHVGFLNSLGIPSAKLKQGEVAQFVCEIESYEDLYDVAVGIILKNKLNIEILTFNSYMYNNPLSYMKKGSKYITRVEFKVPKIFPQDYVVTVAIADGTQLNHNQQHWVHVATNISILSNDLVDACILTLNQEDVKYHYMQVM